MTTSQFDEALTTAHFFENPYPLYHQMREQAPVYWSDAWQAWVITRYDDVMAVLKDSDNYSSAGRVIALLNKLPPEARQQVAALERHYEIGIAHTDPPDHTRVRNLLNKVFTPRMVNHWQTRIQEVVNQKLDAAIEKGQLDIIDDIAYPLPATIIAEMLGAPTSDIERFRHWATAINHLFELGGKMTPEAAFAAQNSLHEMREYITQLADEKRKNPADDIISQLVADNTEEKLSMAEIVSTSVTFFVAGHETTTNLIGNGMLALLKNPDQMQLLRQQPDLIQPAIEEMLRYDPSVPRGWRIVKQDVTLRGQNISKGALIFPMLAAANRDPEVFDNFDTFDIQRPQNRHLAFGYGIHFCLGAPLARQEGAIAINTLVQRLPNIQLTDAALTWRHDMAIRSLHNLPVTF